MSQLLPKETRSIRADFPLLRHLPNLAYLDNAATSQKPESVLQSMDDYYRGYYANVHRGSYHLSEESSAAYEGSREEVARFLKADSKDIVFTSSATAAINLVALATKLHPGDRIALSEMEHHSNIVPWYLLAENCGAELDWIRVRSDGTLDEESLGEVLHREPKVLALTHISNVTGVHNDLQRIVPTAKQFGATVLIDGTQAAPRIALQAGKSGEDFYVFSGHKTFGPTGIGVLWGRNLEELQPPTGGGSMISRVSKKKITWADSPRRFEAGTPPIAEAIGLGAALRWLEELPRDRILAHERGLAQEAAGAIRERGGRVWSGEGIVSFALPGIHAHDVAEIIGREDVAVRAGHHCAEILMNRLGERALVRASFAPYNHLDDLQPLLRGIDKSLEIFAN